MKPQPLRILVLCVACMCVGCMAFRSGVQGQYRGETRSRAARAPVTVLFHFTHQQQARGYDALPEIISASAVTEDFELVFYDALSEFTNLGGFDTYTDRADDVYEPKRRAELDSLMRANQFTLQIRIKQERSFAGFYLGALLSTVSATVIPVPYRKDYSLATAVYRSDGAEVACYHRSARISNLVQALLLFAYPFAPEDRKIEELLMEMLHDTFRQIDDEGVLSAN
ncbi:MAG: hypothetical protein IPG71_02160 [bacterium]|nr:hypothetical protein [bacterium]